MSPTSQCVDITTATPVWDSAAAAAGTGEFAPAGNPCTELVVTLPFALGAPVDLTTWNQGPYDQETEMYPPVSVLETVTIPTGTEGAYIVPINGTGYFAVQDALSALPVGTTACFRDASCATACCGGDSGGGGVTPVDNPLRSIGGVLETGDPDVILPAGTVQSVSFVVVLGQVDFTDDDGLATYGEGSNETRQAPTTTPFTNGFTISAGPAISRIFWAANVTP